MLALLLASSAFHAPMGTHLASSRVASPIMRNNERKGAFWNRADWLEKQPPSPGRRGIDDGSRAEAVVEGPFLGACRLDREV